MDLFKSVRTSDVVLTALVTAVAVFVGVANALAGADADVAHPLDSHSWLMVPVFAAAALTVLWRRRHVLAAVGVSFAVVAASLPMFGWVTRCGFALPLAFLLAYAVGRWAGNRQNHVVGLVGLLGLQVVTLVMDASTGGLGGLVLSVPVTAVCYGSGLLVQHRSRIRSDAPTLSESVPV